MKRSKSMVMRRATMPGLETVYEDEALAGGPVKLPFITSFRITTDDIDVHRGGAPAPAIPSRNPNRSTWPITTKEAKPGSYIFTNQPTLVKTPWELDRSKGAGERRARPAPARKELRAPFPQLPREILHCIIDHLESLQTVELGVDVPSLQRDLNALSMTSRSWNRVAREHLYRNLWLPDDVEPKKRKFPLLRRDNRLQCLARTLREAQGLASLVRRLYARPESSSIYKPSPDLETITGIILSCSKLEQVTGLALHQANALPEFYLALASRSRLKEHVWMLEHVLGPNKHASLSPDRFVDSHNKWRCMETLVIKGSFDFCLGPGYVSAILHRLPALKHLALGCFSVSDFHDGTLLTLPALRSLQLDHMPGVTDQGLQQLCRTHLPWTLEKLSLVNLENVSRLRTMQRLLASFTRIRRLTIWQESPLCLPAGIDSASAVSMPMLVSLSLEYLHWDHTDVSIANDILVGSIQAGGLPRLRKLRTPSDTTGIFEALCRPAQYPPLAADEAEYLRMGDLHQKKTGKSAAANNVRYARLNVGRRLAEDHQQVVNFSIISRADKPLRTKRAFASSNGNPLSKIDYCLAPDIPGSDRALANVDEVVRVGRAPRTYALQQHRLDDWHSSYAGMLARQARSEEAMARYPSLHVLF